MAKKGQTENVAISEDIEPTDVDLLSAEKLETEIILDTDQIIASESKKHPEDLDIKPVIDLQNEDNPEHSNNPDVYQKVSHDTTDAYAFSNDPIRDYIYQISQFPLLPQEKERELVISIELGIYAEDKLFRQKKQLTPEEIADLEWIVQEGHHAKNSLVEANLRLVVSLAKRYSSRNLRFQDLIQEGNMGLAHAVNKYDYKKEFRFSTYATWWIRQAITRAIADQGRTIRVPVHMMELINHIGRVKKDYTTQKGREPSLDEIAKELKISVDRVQEILKAAKEPTSIYQTTSGESETEVGDLIVDENQPEHIQLASTSFMHDKLYKMLDTFSPQERDVIILRYGLNDQIEHTLEEVGRQLNFTRERARQIEQKTIAKMKHPSRAYFLSNFISDED